MGSFRSLLRAVALLELDQNKDIFWVWSYPSIGTEAKNSIQSKIAFESHEFVVIQTDEGWFYALSHRGSSDSRVVAVTVVLQTDDFHPAKYRRLLDSLCETYQAESSPLGLLKIYLEAQIKRTFDENGATIDLETLPSPTENVPVKELIRAFQTETILIYTALLLRLRVMVYHHSADELRQMVAAAASLMSHRPDFFKDTYPLMSNSEADVSFLRAKSSYLAGVTDASMGSRMDMMDLWVALPSAEVIIAVHAKESLSRCKTHKDIALFMCRCAENSRLSDGDTVKEIAAKTRLLLAAVAKTVHGYPDMSAEKAIEAASLSPTLESFYKAIAKVEKIHN